jgi:hypothetical protein
MPAKPLPTALKSMRKAWRKATDERLRDRLADAVRGLERLYGVRSILPPEDGDMRRRKMFSKFTHRPPPRLVRPLPEKGESNVRP